MATLIHQVKKKDKEHVSTKVCNAKPEMKDQDIQIDAEEELKQRLRYK